MKNIIYPKYNFYNNVQYQESNGDHNYASYIFNTQGFYKTTFSSPKEADKKIKELNRILRKEEKAARDAKYEKLLHQYELGKLKSKPKKEKSFTPYIDVLRFDEPTNTLYYTITIVHSHN